MSTDLFLDNLLTFSTSDLSIKLSISSRHTIVVNVLECDIIVSKFELQSCYYIHFWTNTLGKGMNTIYP